MKTKIFFFTMAFALIVFSGLPADCQSLNIQAQRNTEQWRSHQMNQPSPEASEKDNLSVERVDEIRQLYLEAKRESETKTQTGNQPPASVNHQIKQSNN
ncbi:MAG: hypothetical protein PHS86_04440 [Syntrophaceae bacterium]|nr:hypothetical protein [Syntrophaceae bacterium]